MKKLLLITVLLVAITTKLSAQEMKIIEIKNSENNQFKITAKEDMNINLKFTLEAEDVCKVLVCDKHMKELVSKINHNKGEYKVAFTIEEGEHYIIKIIGNNPIKLIATTVAEN